jgi:hypothetical protein
VRRFIAAFFRLAEARVPPKKAALKRRTPKRTFWSAAIHRRFLSFGRGPRPAKESGVETPHSKK